MSTGEGTYNALQVQLTRSFHNGLAATVAYSWSKSIDEGCSGFFGSEGCNIQQIYNPKAERSVSAFDVPQNLAHMELRIADRTRQGGQHTEPGSGSAGWRMAV